MSLHRSAFIVLVIATTAAVASASLSAQDPSLQRVRIHACDPSLPSCRKRAARAVNSQRKPSSSTTLKDGTCPPRPDIPNKVPRLSEDELAAAWSLVNATLAPCQPFAKSPSTATSISAVITLGGVHYYYNAGCVDSWATTKTPPTNDTIYRLASISKTFAVQGVISALEAGDIASLDDTLRKYMPGFSIGNTFTNDEPTLRQLMSQQAGLPRDSPCSFLDCNQTTAEMLRRVAAQRLIVAPYERPSYSNLAYSLLGHMLQENIYHYSTYEDYLTAKVTGPLNLSSTGVDFTPAVLQRMAKEYTKGGIPVPVADLHWDNPAGGVYTTTSDMADWMDHFLSKWRTEARYKELLQPIFVDGSETHAWGAPWEIVMSDPSTGYLIRNKGGYIPGVSSEMALVPELNLGITVLWNGEGMDTQGILVDMVNAILPMIVLNFQQENTDEFPPVSSNFLNGGAGFLGEYAFLDAVRANISYRADIQRVHASIPGFGSFWLKPSTLPSDNGLVFQLYLHADNYYRCMDEAFAAYVGEWVTFSTTTDGVPQFSVPGYVWGVFKRV